MKKILVEAFMFFFSSSADSSVVRLSGEKMMTSREELKSAIEHFSTDPVFVDYIPITSVSDSLDDLVISLLKAGES